MILLGFFGGIDDLIARSAFGVEDIESEIRAIDGL